jgi:hypothetical protein
MEKFCERRFPDKEYDNDIILAMIVLNNLDKIDKTITKRLLVQGIHHLTDEEKKELGTYLQENVNKKERP